jgi:tetratricopeptide (TPR) repeat protein
MNEPHDPNRTVDVPSASGDSLDAGLAAGFGRPADAPSSVLQQLRAGLGPLCPVLLPEAQADSAHVVKPRSDAMPSPEESGARYQLQGEIARGGMGAVLRGRDVDLGRDLAVKILLEKHADNPAVARRFIEEAQIGGQLQHPGVVPVYDIGRFGERPFFTMKLVKGHTLAALLSERETPVANAPGSPRDLSRFLATALQVAQAVAYAHAKGVIHRDLKPANVMVGAFGEVQVMDWGLAKVLGAGAIAGEEKASRERERADDASLIRTSRSTGSAGTFGTQTEAGSLLGTPAYMPPEQANGDLARVDRRADVFGLGAILCEVLTGKPPYVGRSGEEVRRKACNGDLADAMARLDACGADPELFALTKACLAPEAIDRPKDAQAVAESLSTYQIGVQERLETAQRERAVALAREAEQRKRRRVQLALAAAAVALLVGGGAFAWWRNDQAQAGRERDARNAEAVAALLAHAEEALRAGDSAKAAVALDAANKRSAEGGAEQEASRIARLVADLALLRELDDIDQHRWTVVDGKFPNPAVAPRRTWEALRRAGADPDAAPADEAAARVSASAVRERIVSALDRLLLPMRLVDVTRLPEGEQKLYTQLRADLAGLVPRVAGVRALLRRVDAHPYRDAVRDAILAEDRAKFVELAGQTAALKQPPGFVAFLGESRAIEVQRRRQLLEAAVGRRPGDMGLLMTLGWTYPVDKGRADEKLRWFQAAIAAAPANVAALNGLGCVLCDGKSDHDGAIACFRKALALDPKNAAAHYNLGNALQNKGQVDEAIACFQKALALDPKLAMAHVNLGNALQNKGQVDKVIACLRRAIALDPNLPQAHNNLGGILCNVKHDYDGAVACFRKAIELDPKSASAHYNLGNALHGKGQVGEAIACFKNAIALDPNLVQAYNSLGEDLHVKGQVDEAIACFQKAVALTPKDPRPHNSLGRALADKGQVDEAIACFHKALALDPKLAHAHASLGRALGRKGRQDEAIACLRKAIALDPKLDRAHFSLGIELADKGRVDEAIACFRKAIELDPKSSDAHFILGVKLCDVKREYDGAIACFRKVIALDPKRAKAHCNLGLALYRKGQDDEAIACFQNAIALDPNLASAHNGLGNALHEKGCVDEAIASWRKAVQLAPKLAETHANLGGVLVGKGRLDEAIAFLRKAVELAPMNAPAHFSLGNALHRKGQVDEAIASYREAIALDPRCTPAYHFQGVLLCDIKRDHDGAIACFRKTIELAPKFAAAHYCLGVALSGKGQWDEAITSYQKAIALDPKHASAHAHLGFALDRTGKLGEAIDAWRRSVALQPAQPNVWYWIARAEARRGRNQEAALVFRKVRELYPPTSSRAQEAQRFLVAKRLPALLRGEDRPADNAERLAFARLAHDRKHYAFAARLWAEALANDPRLGDDRTQQHRYRAARSAALAAAGQGEGEPPLDDAAKAKLRGQALGWLKADQAAWGKHLDSGPLQARPTLVKTLRHWQRDPDLAGLRDKEPLAKLSAQEQKAFTQLWAKVAALLQKAEEKPKGGKP